MAKGVDGVGLAAVGLGGALMYAGIKGYSFPAVLENLVTGKPIRTDVKMTPLTSDAVSGGLSGALSGGSSPEGGLAGTSEGINQSIALPLAAAYGWTGAEWSALQTLWTKESNWRNTALNPDSGAYGIPQALPHTKMPKAAWPESAGGTSDARAQIEWGLAYIQNRYGSPSAALQFHLRNNWY